MDENILINVHKKIITFKNINNSPFPLKQETCFLLELSYCIKAIDHLMISFSMIIEAFYIA